VLLGGERLRLIRKSGESLEKVDWVSGACLMIRQSLFKRLSGFDESFFMYMEDMELCFRAKKLGFLTYFYPDICLKHKELGSSNRTFAITHIYKGILYFYLKHKSYLEYLIVKALLIVKATVLIIVGSVTASSSLSNRYKKALSFIL
jgi:GT2 family glycosyltransferase